MQGAADGTEIPDNPAKTALVGDGVSIICRSDAGWGAHICLKFGLLWLVFALTQIISEGHGLTLPGSGYRTRGSVVERQPRLKAPLSFLI